ncbi:MAG TPA: D-glycero-beta-D-manno-heptose 1-phosphate adenylyltransferase [Bdellovibrionota bacterium]|nr:D-glycero-beta-D-manno-heptose 1-phosphate adenylyltransferase [Bdellovibrionota bacterium]
MQSKIKNLKEFLPARKKLKGKLVFTNGCFDLLHVGHIRYLQEARKLGDYLIIGLNSDKSVKKIKGSFRPIIPETERAEVLAALESVSFVVLFDEDTPYELISAIQPDVLVKGGDWKGNDIVGKDIVEAYGGKVLSLSYIQGRSTTDIIDKVLQSR